MPTQTEAAGVGFLVILVGILIVFASLLFSGREKTEFKYSVVGFLGFIPFGFGNDKKLLVLALMFGIVAVIAFLILRTTSWRALP